MELLSKLGIDWKLLVAQTINFFLLLAILFYTVYRPVLGILAKRSKRIEDGIKNAETAEKKLKEIEKLQEERMSATERKVGELIETARKDAESMRVKILADAGTEVEDLLRRARLQTEEEKVKMMSEIRKEVAGIIVHAATRLMKREFSAEDQSRLLEAINEEIKSL